MSRGENCEPVIGHPGFTPDLTSRNLPNTHELRFSEEVSHLFPGIAHESDSFSSHFIRWNESRAFGVRNTSESISSAGRVIAPADSSAETTPRICYLLHNEAITKCKPGEEVSSKVFYFLFISFPLFFLQHGPFFSSKLKLKEAGLLGRATAKLHQERRSATANTGRSSGGNTAA